MLTSMNPNVLLGVAGAAVLLLLLWLWQRGRKPPVKEHAARSARVDTLDTVLAWPPEATRILTLPERKAYLLLSRALPEYMVLAQVPVSRFIRVPTRNSYHEWMRRVGQLCADLVVCDASSQVIAVIDVRRPPEKDSERTRSRHDRMDRVLRKAGLRVIEWNEEALPHPNTVREQVLPTADAPAAGPVIPPLKPKAAPVAVPATAAAGAAAPALAMVELDEVLEGYDRAAAADDFGLADPTPSTWFDDLDSRPAPLSNGRA